MGRSGIGVFEILGRSAIFLVTSLRVLPSGQAFSRFVHQLYSVGVLSMVIIMVSGLFIGMVLGLQGYTILVRYGSEQALGQMVGLTLLRELAPVVGALLFAGRAGSALTAEIGLMKATEQLSSLEMMGVDPLHRIVAPRFLASVIAMPLLVCIFSTVGIIGAYLVGVQWLGVDSGSFWANMAASIDVVDDLGNGLVKAVVFGVVVSWIAVFQGFDCEPTSEGISRATTKTVVYSSLAVLGLDFLLTAVMFGEF